VERGAELEQARAQVSDLERKVQQARDESAALQREDAPANRTTGKRKTHTVIAWLVTLTLWTVCGGAWIRTCNGCVGLNEEKRAYARMTKVSGWVRSEGPAFGNWTMAPKSCATGSRLHFRGVTLDGAWSTSRERRGQHWLRVIEDQVRGTVLKLRAPGRDPVVLDGKRCAIKSSWKRPGRQITDATIHQGAIAFDCTLDDGRITGHVQFLACSANTTPNAEYDRRKMGVW